MRSLLRSILSIGVCTLCFVGFLPNAEAATLTVCNSAVTCDYTTVEDALNNTADGDTVTVQGPSVNAISPYDATVENAWPIHFGHASNTLECVGGATISQTDPIGNNELYLTTSSTVSGCTFGNIFLTTEPDVITGDQAPYGMMILNNTFSTMATSTISFSNSGGTDFLISGNTNLQSFNSGNATSTRGIIRDNDFRNFYRPGYGGLGMVSTNASTTNLSFFNNTFSNVVTANTGGNNLLGLAGADIVFATNTIRYLSPITNSSGAFSSLYFSASGTQNYIGGNYIEAATSGVDACYGIYLDASQNIRVWSSTMNITHNTIFLGRSSTCTAEDSLAVVFVPSNSYSSLSLTANISYNIFDKEFGANAVAAVSFQAMPATTTLNITNDYNGTYGFTTAIRKKVNFVITDLTNTHDYTDSYPFLKLDDVSTANDLELVPFSPYLDVNSTLDIGAYSAVRNGTIDLDDAGTINYTSVDATSTYRISEALRNGDTLNFAGGDYAGFDIVGPGVSSYLSSLTITGAGSGLTSIVAGTNRDALYLENVTSTSIGGLNLTSANDLQSGYRLTRIVASTTLHDYNDASLFLGANAGDMVLFDATVCSGPPAVVVEDSRDFSAAFDGSSDVHLVLIEIGGNRLTGLVPDNYLPGIGSVVARVNAACGGMITAEAAATSTFTATGGNYTYHSSTLTDAGINLISGITTPPSIETSIDAYAGLALSNASVVASNMTYSNNGYGVLILDGSGSSTFMNSTSTGNLLYDFEHEANTTSTLSNVSFLTASTTFISTGGLDVYYDGRVSVADTEGDPLAGISVAAVPASVGGSSDLGMTDADGYTAYRSLLAHRLNSSSISLTNAGTNPYTWTTGTSGAYVATTTSENLSTAYQTVTLAMSTRQIGFTQASGSGAESVASPTVRVGINATSASPITVTYTVTGGTATGSGNDYTLASGTATIDAGETSTTIPLVVINDSTDESNETIVITLSGPSGAELGTTAYTYTITDDDEAPSSSGGGGGGSGGGATSFIPSAVVASPLPIIQPPVSTAPLPAPEPMPVLPAMPVPELGLVPSEEALAIVDRDARAYGIQLGAGDRVRLALFIDHGVSPETRALGLGERVAMLKDAYETTGRAVSNDDLARLAKGEIGKARSLPRETALQPRALATFQAIYGPGRKPNFQNPEENLAWNTLMYRIRFPRDLKKEREGIQEFKSLFKKDPKDPFQWAVVRVFGYVEK